MSALAHLIDLVSNTDTGWLDEYYLADASATDIAEEIYAKIRAEVVGEAVSALQAKAGELSDLAEEKMRRDLEETAQEWHRAADEVARLAKKTGGAA